MDKNAYMPGDFPERVTIVGGGPAGLAAAIYAARAGLTPVVVAPPLGGQLQGKGVDVENYPGLPDMTGPGIVNNMREQAIHFGTKFEGVEVVSIDAASRPIRVITNTSVIESHTVIIATGADSKWLGIPGEWELRGGGVSSCATCDGFLFKDKHVVVVGGGDTAMEDALVLARTSEKVTIVHRRDEFRASAILAERVVNHDRIEIVWNATVTEILGETITLGNSEEGEAVEERLVRQRRCERREQRRATTIPHPSSEERPAIPHPSSEELPPYHTLLDPPYSPSAAPLTLASLVKVVSGVKVQGVDGNINEMSCSAVFVAIGHVPNTKIVEGVCDFDVKHTGYLATRVGTTQTSADGIFAAGDSADAVYRQAITSAGSGAAAALDAERYLSEKGLGNEAAEFEAELLREMMGEEEGKEAEGGYNAYEGGNMGKGQKESAGVKEEKKKPEKKEKKPAPAAKVLEEEEEHIEL